MTSSDLAKLNTYHWATKSICLEHARLVEVITIHFLNAVVLNLWNCFCVVVFFVNSPDGYLYDKQAILEFILHQKKEIAKQMKVRSNVLESITLTRLIWGVLLANITSTNRGEGDTERLRG